MNQVLKNNLGKFFVVATPIGNLEDISQRALRVLGEVNLILAEDTRVTGKLLNKFGLETKMVAYNSHSNDSKSEKVFSLLEKGKNIALVSDAGTPTISDPGVKIIKELREKYGNLVEIISIPGPSALVSALSISGISSSEFIFYGFLPQKKGRKTKLEEILENKKTSVFYESPHRLLKVLEFFKENLDSQRKIFIARELTKIYEEGIYGNIEEVFEYFKNKKIKGEIVVVVEGV